MPVPGAAKGWVNLVKQAVFLGLVPFLLLAWTNYRDARREDANNLQHAEVVKQMRDDLKEARGNTDKVLDKLLSMISVQAADMKKEVKAVAAEVKTTGDAVKAVVPTPI